MESWYEETGPTESQVENTMQTSEVWICLHKKHNTQKEEQHLQSVVSNILNRESFENHPLRHVNQFSSRLQTITYKSIRKHPKWKEFSNTILREEVIAHKPYGSWRGYSTSVMNRLREKCIIRIVREIWAVRILDTGFVPVWLAHNYSPNADSQGYQRITKHYASLVK